MKPHVEVAMASLYRQKDGDLEFLIVRRVPDDGGFWQPVTGGIEPGEAARETVIREIAEETGITELLHISDVLLQTQWEMEDHSGEDFVHAVEVAHNVQITLSEEHDDHHWLPLEEAVKLLRFEGNKDALRLVHKYAQHRVLDKN